jgi:hypothetical protein
MGNDAARLRWHWLCGLSSEVEASIDGTLQPLSVDEHAILYYRWSWTFGLSVQDLVAALVTGDVETLCRIFRDFVPQCPY